MKSANLNLQMCPIATPFFQVIRDRSSVSCNKLKQTGRTLKTIGDSPQWTAKFLPLPHIVGGRKGPSGSQVF